MFIVRRTFTFSIFIPYGELVVGVFIFYGYVFPTGNDLFINRMCMLATPGSHNIVMNA